MAAASSVVRHPVTETTSIRARVIGSSRMRQDRAKGDARPRRLDRPAGRAVEDGRDVGRAEGRQRREVVVGRTIDAPPRSAAAMPRRR